jgi:hypothetical protein
LPSGDGGIAQPLHRHHVLEGHGPLGRFGLCGGEGSKSKRSDGGEKDFAHWTPIETKREKTAREEKVYIERQFIVQSLP